MILAILCNVPFNEGEWIMGTLVEGLDTGEDLLWQYYIPNTQL